MPYSGRPLQELPQYQATPAGSVVHSAPEAGPSPLQATAEAAGPSGSRPAAAACHRKVLASTSRR